MAGTLTTLMLQDPAFNIEVLRYHCHHAS